MIDIERRAAELCAAPASCAFLLAVEEAGLAPEEAAEPVAAFLAALALDEVSPWSGGHERVVGMALEQGSRLLPLAREILSQPAAAAWFARLGRRAQQWVFSPDEAASIPMPARPDRPPDHWERYAQKADWGLWTSTELDDAGTVPRSWRASPTGPATSPLTSRRPSPPTVSRFAQWRGCSRLPDPRIGIDSAPGIPPSGTVAGWSPIGRPCPMTGTASTSRSVG